MISKSILTNGKAVVCLSDLCYAEAFYGSKLVIDELVGVLSKGWVLQASKMRRKRFLCNML